MDLDIRPLTGETWTALSALFEEGGDPSWCWCQFWRGSGFNPIGPNRRRPTGPASRRRHGGPSRPAWSPSPRTDEPLAGSASARAPTTSTSSGPESGRASMTCRSGRSCASSLSRRARHQGVAGQLLDGRGALRPGARRARDRGLPGRHGAGQAHPADPLHRHLVDVRASRLPGHAPGRFAPGNGRPGHRPAGPGMTGRQPDHHRLRHRHRRQPGPALRLRLARRRDRRDHLLLAATSRRARSPRTIAGLLELVGRTRHRGRARAGRSRSFGRCDRRPRRTARAASAMPSCRRRAAAFGPPRRRPDHRGGAPPAGRDDAGHARAADQPGRGPPARAGAAAPAATARDHGRRVPLAGQHGADHRVERPLSTRRPPRSSCRLSAAIEADPAVTRPLALGLDVTEHAKFQPDHLSRLARRAGSRPDDAIALAGARIRSRAERGRSPPTR